MTASTKECTGQGADPQLMSEADFVGVYAVANMSRPRSARHLQGNALLKNGLAS